MSQQNTAQEMITTEEELSDYLLVLTCMRKRFEAHAMLEALDRLEKLETAISRAIVDRRPPPTLRIVA
ncbi:MAG TPA: hypothetical protein VMF58_15775 [Rhizomicrobium sp.]|nr:hypothetical protein [Rhizomicrobium sp.]